jgi:hypothetical protein
MARKPASSAPAAAALTESQLAALVVWLKEVTAHLTVDLKLRGKSAAAARITQMQEAFDKSRTSPD